MLVASGQGPSELTLRIGVGVLSRVALDEQAVALSCVQSPNARPRAHSATAGDRNESDCSRFCYQVAGVARYSKLGGGPEFATNALQAFGSAFVQLRRECGASPHWFPISCLAVDDGSSTSPCFPPSRSPTRLVIPVTSAECLLSRCSPTLWSAEKLS